MSDIFFNTACKELKIPQIAQLNQLFQLLHLALIYGHSFYWVSRMLMSKNVNNDVSKDSPIRQRPMRPLRLPSSQRLSRANHTLITLPRTSNHYCQYATEGQQLTITGKNTDEIKRKGKVHSIPLIQDLKSEFYTFGVMLNLLC